MGAALCDKGFGPGMQMASFDAARHAAVALARPLDRSEEVPIALAAVVLHVRQPAPFREEISHADR